MCNAVIKEGHKKYTRFIVSNLVLSKKRLEFTTEDVLSDLKKYKISASPRVVSDILTDFCRNGEMVKDGNKFVFY